MKSCRTNSTTTANTPSTKNKKESTGSTKIWTNTCQSYQYWVTLIRYLLEEGCNMDEVLVGMAMLREHVKIRLQPLIRSSTYKKRSNHGKFHIYRVGRKCSIE